MGAGPRAAVPGRPRGLRAGRGAALAGRAAARPRIGPRGGAAPRASHLEAHARRRRALLHREPARRHEPGDLCPQAARSGRLGRAPVPPAHRRRARGLRVPGPERGRGRAAPRLEHGPAAGARAPGRLRGATRRATDRRSGTRGPVLVHGERGPAADGAPAAARGDPHGRRGRCCGQPLPGGGGIPGSPPLDQEPRAPRPRVAARRARVGRRPDRGLARAPRRARGRPRRVARARDLLARGAGLHAAPAGAGARGRRGQRPARLGAGPPRAPAPVRARWRGARGLADPRGAGPRARAGARPRGRAAGSSRAAPPSDPAASRPRLASGCGRPPSTLVRGPRPPRARPRAGFDAAGARRRRSPAGPRHPRAGRVVGGRPRADRAPPRAPRPPRPGRGDASARARCRAGGLRARAPGPGPRAPRPPAQGPQPAAAPPARPPRLRPHRGDHAVPHRARGVRGAAPAHAPLAQLRRRPDPEPRRRPRGRAATAPDGAGGRGALALAHPRDARAGRARAGAGHRGGARPGRGGLRRARADLRQHGAREREGGRLGPGGALRRGAARAARLP